MTLRLSLYHFPCFFNNRSLLSLFRDIPFKFNFDGTYSSIYTQMRCPSVPHSLQPLVWSIHVFVYIGFVNLRNTLLFYHRVDFYRALYWVINVLINNLQIDNSVRRSKESETSDRDGSPLHVWSTFRFRFMFISTRFHLILLEFFSSCLLYRTLLSLF